MAQAPAQPTQPSQPGMMQQATDPLAALRDIHEPAMISSWPPAPGWWLLAALASVFVIYLLVLMIRRWLADRYRREAISELQQLTLHWQSHGNDTQYLQDLQTLLKRVALTRFPRDDVAGLTGEAWVQFLDRSSGSHDFSMGVAEVLIDGNYRQDTSFDAEALQSAARQWINTHDPKYLEAEQQAA